MKRAVLFLLGCTLAIPAFAAAVQATEGTPSRALQQSRRVASMENDKDLPSRAVWLGHRVAKNSKIAFQEKSSRKQRKGHSEQQ